MARMGEVVQHPTHPNRNSPPPPPSHSTLRHQTTAACSVSKRHQTSSPLSFSLAILQLMDDCDRSVGSGAAEEHAYDSASHKRTLKGAAGGVIAACDYCRVRKVNTDMHCQFISRIVWKPTPRSGQMRWRSSVRLLRQKGSAVHVFQQASGSACDMAYMQ
jgi:hypothetical protein